MVNRYLSLTVRYYGLLMCAYTMLLIVKTLLVEVVVSCLAVLLVERRGEQ